MHILHLVESEVVQETVEYSSAERIPARNGEGALVLAEPEFVTAFASSLIALVTEKFQGALDFLAGRRRKRGWISQ